MNFEDLKNPELQEKLRSAKTPEDILVLAKEEGFELTDEQIGKPVWWRKLERTRMPQVLA